MLRSSMRALLNPRPNKGLVPNNQVYCIDTIILAATKALKLIKGAAAEFEFTQLVRTRQTGISRCAHFARRRATTSLAASPPACADI
jgi:hypothetical protein